MQSLNDARNILFAEPADTFSDTHPETAIMTLDDAIDYAEWQVTVAQSHLDDLKRQKAELDREIERQYQQHLDGEFGKVALESDCHDCHPAIRKLS